MNGGLERTFWVKEPRGEVTESPNHAIVFACHGGAWRLECTHSKEHAYEVVEPATCGDGWPETFVVHRTRGQGVRVYTFRRDGVHYRCSEQDAGEGTTAPGSWTADDQPDD